MARMKSVLLKARKSIQDTGLLKVLQSEINHELTTKPFQNDESGSLGDFAVDWDSSQSQDVVLRKKSESGEEIAVSALLGQETFDDNKYSREVLMKVCVKKPGLSSILQFDCGVFSKGSHKSDYDIVNAYYLQSVSSFDSSVYKGPPFSSLDPQLQDELKKYLTARGIEESFTNFLILHLHKKEQGQYVNWLHKLESFVSQSK